MAGEGSVLRGVGERKRGCVREKGEGCLQMERVKGLSVSAVWERVVW